MKIIPKKGADYALLSNAIVGMDSGKDEATCFYRSLVSSGQFREDQLAILHSDKKDKWWVAHTKDAVKKDQNRLRERDRVRNAAGYRAKAFGFNPSAA